MSRILTVGLNGSDETSLNFIPADPLPFAQEVNLYLDTSVKASNGLFLQDSFELTLSTPENLQVLETIPNPGNRDVNPSSPVVVTFNNPVVPLTSAGTSGEPAFYLDPPSEGRGEWLNTSTYIFYPDPPLISGMIYTLSISGDLKSLQGGALSYEEPELLNWSFTTAEAEWISIDPLPGTQLGLNGEITIKFNQPMEPASFENNLYLQDADENLYPGTLAWNEDQTEVIFKAGNLAPQSRVFNVCFI